MCLIAFAWRPGHDCPLVVAANRDEFHDRPTMELEWWNDCPDVLGGRDLRAGGTWMGVSRQGRFAALTNYREMQQTPEGAPSRGALVADFLAGDMPALDYAAAVDVEAYAGFSLLLLDGEALYFLGNRDPAGVMPIEPGMHALSNGALDSAWPKVTSAREGLHATVNAGADTTALLDLMRQEVAAPDDALPDTGVGVELERFLSPMFISGPRYGTRATTVLRLQADGAIEMAERRFCAEGQVDGETRIRFQVTPA